jgi:hypothetical protein
MATHGQRPQLGQAPTFADSLRVVTVVLAQNSIWLDGGQGQESRRLGILRASTLIAMMQAADLREGNNVIACGG